jgi:hypothetical protein
MTQVLFPVPSLDFDPSEVAIGWQVLTEFGHQVSFATPDGRPAGADPIMLSGQGLDLWSPLPQRPEDFLGVPRDDPHHRRKTSRLAGDTVDDETPAWWWSMAVMFRVAGQAMCTRWPGASRRF